MRHSHKAGAAALVGLVGVGAWAEQGWRKVATPGAYRVVVTDPVVIRGQTVAEVSYQDEKIAEAFNRMASQGLAPQFVVPMCDRRVVIAARE
ncbi:MAG: hypothetical protein ACREIU_10095 [Planctomycetota bacterium]